MAELDARRIATAGAASLLVELTVLRYVPGQVRVLGYFTNLVLLAAFLGLGLGMLAVRRFRGMGAHPSWCAPASLLALVALAEVGHRLRVMAGRGEFLFLEYQSAAPKIPLYPFLAVSYVLIALLFVPIGHWVGRTLAGERPLARYAYNIAGSLAGIAAFTLLSAASARPWMWIACAGVSLLGVLHDAPAIWRGAGLVAVGAATFAAQLGTGDAVWSPYQKISIAPLRIHPLLGPVQEWTLPRLIPSARAEVTVLPHDRGFTVRVNDDSYQTPLDLSDAALARQPGLGALRLQYDLPYAGRAPGDVLVLGAGTGNDVAAALRAGATRVDAVEIDPEILALGRQHPEHPYDDARVQAKIADARTFLARSERQYDTIVYGLLDSHVLLGTVSNVRLDSYVFTAESFAAAKKRLRSGGILVVSHAVGLPWFVDRMRATLARAFDRAPDVVSERARNPLGYVYAVGDGVPEGRPVDPDTPVLEDDWPFVYLRERAIPSEYLIAMALMAVASVGLVRAFGGAGWASPDSLHFAALGAAFLLLETRGLSVLALVLGSTWGVTSAVFAGVLVMALAGTITVSKLRREDPQRQRKVVLRMYGGLAAALALDFFVTTGDLASLPLALRAMLGATLVSLPLFAGGMIFATSLARSGEADRAIAANLMGAMAGGLLEYVAMITGFRMLVVVAGLLYGVTLLQFLFSRPSAGVSVQR
jgi:SAM-dependent methyltransferase